MAADPEVLDNTLSNAISKAVETHKEELKQDQSETEVVEDSESERESERAPAKKREEEGEDEDAKQGKILIQGLKDPQKAAAIIDYLATQAGYTKQNIQTKQDVREAKEEITSILERNLGEEFKFLAPKLAPAIKETLENMLSERDDTRDLRARIEKQELKEIQSETSKTHTSLSQEWFGSDDMPSNVVKAMSEAIDEFPPTDPNMSPDRYYRRIFSMVAGELNLVKRSQGQSRNRVSRNLEDSVARNLSAENRGVTPSTSGNPRKMTLKDAVSLAVEQVGQASKK